MNATQMVELLVNYLVSQVERKLQDHQKLRWLPCKSFGLTPRKAERLGLRVSHVGKTPHLNVDEFNKYAEARAKPSNTNEREEMHKCSQESLKAEFGVKEKGRVR